MFLSQPKCPRATPGSMATGPSSEYPAGLLVYLVAQTKKTSEKKDLSAERYISMHPVRIKITLELKPFWRVRIPGFHKLSNNRPIMAFSFCLALYQLKPN